MNELPDTAQTRRVRRTRKQWQQIINEYESDNLTQKEFCAKHNLGIVSFNKWFHRLKQQPQDSGFVALSSPNAVATKQTPMEPQQTRGLEVRLELGDGLVLHLSQ